MIRIFVCAIFLVYWALPGQADEFELSNGDKIEATLVGENEKFILVEHPQLGRIEIPRAALKPPKPPNPGLFGTHFLKGWSRHLGVGFSGSSGNSSDASFNASVAIATENEDYRGALNSSYFFASQNSEQTTNEFFLNYQHDFLSRNPLTIFLPRAVTNMMLFRHGKIASLAAAVLVTTFCPERVSSFGEKLASVFPDPGVRSPAGNRRGSLA